MEARQVLAVNHMGGAKALVSVGLCACCREGSPECIGFKMRLLTI